MRSIAIAAVTIHHRLEVRGTRSLALIVAAVLLLAACAGGDGTSRPATTASAAAEPEPTPDPKYLVAQLSDLPPRFTLVPGEKIPLTLASVLADPWSAGVANVIRRERVAGYETSFWSPERRRIECSAAVYRSIEGAKRVYRNRTRRFAAFLAASRSGRTIPVKQIGEETDAYRFEIRGSRGLTLGWRYRNVLASCETLGLHPADLREIVFVAMAQQARISRALE